MTRYQLNCKKSRHCSRHDRGFVPDRAQPLAPTRVDRSSHEWTVALTLLGGAIAAFYVYSDQSLLLRVVGLLAVAGISVTLILFTAKGRSAWDFMQESRTEVRKVVWPTRQETVQTTLVVIAMVTVVAIFLWLLDMLLAWIVKSVIGVGA